MSTEPFNIYEIQIKDIQQLIPEECSNIDQAYFANSCADRSQKLLERLSYDQDKAIFVEDKQDYSFPDKPSFSIFIDASCMSRKNLGALFEEIGKRFLQAPDHKITLYIGYTLSKYAAPKKGTVIINNISAINPFFAGAPRRKDDSALVVALGYEKSKALGAVENLEMNKLWVFIPDSPEKKFASRVKKENQDLLETIEPSHCIQYKVLEPVATFYQLASLVYGMMKDVDLILLPLGPKIFVTLSLLLGLLQRHIPVFFVDSDDDDHGASLESSEHSVVFKCLLMTDIGMSVDRN